MKKTYSIGELDQRITITRSVNAADGQGGYTSTDSEVDTVWAHVRPLSLSERLHAGALEAAQSYLVVVRYRSDLRDSDMIDWAGLRLNIKGISNGGGRALYTEIQAERGVAV